MLETTSARWLPTWARNERCASMLVTSPDGVAVVVGAVIGSPRVGDGPVLSAAGVPAARAGGLVCVTAGLRRRGPGRATGVLLAAQVLRAGGPAQALHGLLGRSQRAVQRVERGLDLVCRGLRRLLRLVVRVEHGLRHLLGVRVCPRLLEGRSGVAQVPPDLHEELAVQVDGG